MKIIQFIMADSRHFAKHMRVELTGLVQRTDLNGLRACVISIESARIGVMTDIECELVRARPTNLVIVDSRVVQTITAWQLITADTRRLSSPVLTGSERGWATVCIVESRRRTWLANGRSLEKAIDEAVNMRSALDRLSVEAFSQFAFEPTPAMVPSFVLAAYGIDMSMQDGPTAMDQW